MGIIVNKGGFVKNMESEIILEKEYRSPQIICVKLYDLPTSKSTCYLCGNEMEASYSYAPQRIGKKMLSYLILTGTGLSRYGVLRDFNKEDTWR